MRKMMSIVVVCATLTASLIGASAAQAATKTGVLRNSDTGLCIARPQQTADRALPVFTAACDDAATQQWAYSTTEQTIRPPGTGLCLSTGSSSGIFVAACDSGLLVHWEITSDGRIHQLDWGIGCVEDYRTQHLTWGPCTNDSNEVWSLTAA